MSQATSNTHSQLSQKELFLREFERAYETTMKVLRAYPEDQLDLRPHETSRTARELAWIFVLERFLGMMVFKGAFNEQASGETPPPPDSWDELLGAFEKAQREYGDLIRSTPESEFDQRVRFFTGPHTVGTYTRIEWLWFILHDEIHHRGQFSVYLRMAGGKVPSIYGPSGDEQWI